MTAKEKAEELVEKFLPEITGADRYNYNIESMNVFIGTKCALIAIDEIINANPSLPILSESGNLYSDIQESKSYWQEVKNELLKL